jgi:hypothetical protein
MAKPIRLLEPSEVSSASHETSSIRQSEILPFRTRERLLPDGVEARIERLLEHDAHGDGLAHPHLLPDDHRGAADEYDREYYDQARLLDAVTRLARAAAPSPRYSAENPTLGVLDYLIARGAVTHPTLIADVLSSDAHLLLLGGDKYVTGVGWPRVGIVRTRERLEPIFREPAVRMESRTAEYVLVPAYREWEIVYFRAAPHQPQGRVPAYPVTLAAACGLRQCDPQTMYTWTSGKRTDWVLDRARIRPRPDSRELLFNPILFWRWLHGYQRD